jgi:hypothetical protein
MQPEQALTEARRAAAQMRAAGAYADAQPSSPGPPRPEFAERKLVAWAVVEPDLSQIRSIRRYGAPITWFKRWLLRLLAQYHAQVLGDQARFNLLLLGYVRALERRIGELEQTQGGDARTPRDLTRLADDVARMIDGDQS